MKWLIVGNFLIALIAIFLSAFVFKEYKPSDLPIISASSNTKEIKMQKKNKKELSTIVAQNLAKKAKDMKITKVYFDRGIYKYHGRVKVFAETLRENGMEF